MCLIHASAVWPLPQPLCLSPVPHALYSSLSNSSDGVVIAEYRKNGTGLDSIAVRKFSFPFPDSGQRMLKSAMRQQEVTVGTGRPGSSGNHCHDQPCFVIILWNWQQMVGTCKHRYCNPLPPPLEKNQLFWSAVRGGGGSGRYNFVGNFPLQGRWHNFPLSKFRGVSRAVKMPMALHTVGP